MNTKTLIGLIEIINQYQYGQFNLLEDEFKLTYHKNEECFEFENFHNYDNNKKFGTCTELMIKTYNDVKSQFPNLYVLKIHGRDDKYFNTETSRHYFNILLENTDNIEEIEEEYDMLEHIKNKKIITAEEFDQEIRRRLIANDATLFDPIYKSIKKYKDTEYQIKEIFFEKDNILISTETYLPKFETLPLFIENQKDYLISIHNHPGYDSKLGIVFEKINSNNPIGQDISSRELRKITNPLLQEFIDVIITKEAIRSLIKEKNSRIKSVIREQNRTQLN